MIYKHARSFVPTRCMARTVWIARTGQGGNGRHFEGRVGCGVRLSVLEKHMAVVLALLDVGLIA